MQNVKRKAPWHRLDSTAQEYPSNYDYYTPKNHSVWNRGFESRRDRNCQEKETEIGFPDYIEKAETGAIGRALAMCGYGTLQAPEFDEQDRLADAPLEKVKNPN